MLGLRRSALFPPKALLSSNYDHSNFPTLTDSLQTKPLQATLYQILRIPLGASQTQIKSAYYSLAKQFHHDTASSDPSAAHFMVIHDAYPVEFITCIRRLLRQMYLVDSFGGSIFDTPDPILVSHALRSSDLHGL